MQHLDLFSEKKIILITITITIIIIIIFVTKLGTGYLKHLELPTMFSDFEIERIEILNEYVCVSKAHSF